MSRKYKIPAIVLGMTANGIGAVRSLARAGVKVYACDSYTDRPGMYTRYAQCIACPNALKDPECFKKFLFDLIKRVGGEVVIFPTSDSHNEFLSNHQEQFGFKVKLVLPPKDVMNQLLDKKGQYELAMKHGVSVPKTFFPTTIEEVQKLSSELSYPVIVKGLHTGYWRERFGERKAFTIKDADELIKIYSDIQSKGKLDTVIQEIIEGDDSRHYKICTYINKKGQPLLSFTLQKIRQYPCDFGIGSSVVSKWVPEIAQMGIKFLQDVGYYGIGSIEFKKDKRDEKFKMIEVNPRLWAQNILPSHCGQNFAFTVYQDLLGEAVEPKKDFKEGVKWIAFDDDRASFLGYHRQGRMTWGTWLKSILTGPRVWAYWSWDDPMPFLKEIMTKVSAKLFRKNDSFVLANQDIRVETIKDFNQFLSIENQWNDFINQNIKDNPYVTHQWLAAWWKGYGQNKKLFIVTFWRENNLVGVAPLMKYKTKLLGIFIEILGFVSNHWVTLDIVVNEKYKKECLRKLKEVFVKQKQIIILSFFKESSAIFNDLKEVVSSGQFKVRERVMSAPYIKLNGNWDEYFEGRSYNFRGQYRKKSRRLEKAGKMEFIRYQNYDDLMGCLESMGEVVKRSWQGKQGVSVSSDEKGKRFYQNLIKSWAKEGLIDIAVLKLDNKMIAYLLSFTIGSYYYAFDTAYDKEYQEYSPGMLIHNMLLEQLHTERFKEFDFGFMSDYKNHWTNDSRGISDLLIFPKNIIGYFFSYGHQLKESYQKRALAKKHKKVINNKESEQ